MGKTYTIDEASRKLSAYFEYAGIDLSKLNTERMIRNMDRAMKFKEDYINMKETFNEDMLHLYMTNMIRNYLADEDISQERKLEVAKELLGSMLDK